MKDLKENPTSSQPPSPSEAAAVTGIYSAVKDVLYDPEIPDTCPVPVEEFGKFVIMNHKDTNKGFKELYRV